MRGSVNTEKIKPHYGYDVVVAGDICLDIIPEFYPGTAPDINQVFRPGRTTNVAPMVICTGGPVSNTGIALKRLGLRVAVATRIADDEIGKIIYQYLQKENCTAGVKIIPGASSAYTFVVSLPGIDRMFLHHEGTNDIFSYKDIDFNVVKTSKIFHLGYPPHMRRLYENDGAELVTIFKNARQAGAITSLDLVFPDVNSPAGQANWRRILEKTLPYVDIFLPSIEELFFMVEPENFVKMQDRYGSAALIDYLEVMDYTRIAEKVLDLGTRMVGIKSSHRGIYFRTADKRYFSNFAAVNHLDVDQWCQRELLAPAFTVDNVVSATGAGDSAVAGFLAAFVRGLAPEACLQYANILGYQNLQALDALSSIKNWQETQNMLQSEKLPMNIMPITADGWCWQDELNMFVGPNDRFVNRK